MSKPPFRKLRGYAFDPSFSSTVSRRQTNEVIYKIKWEDTQPGPIGEYLEVLDYDPTRRCYYEPINLEQNYVLADYGLPLAEGDPRFHQQQVYAVIMSIIEQFEKALGRKLIWTRNVELSDGTSKIEFVPKLRVYPHALRQQNAFYSPQKVSLLFGYFQSSGHWSGNNVPNEAIFTCLSPDIVAHETTHAILDSIHPYWRKGTNHDMLAFHEGFSDIIALLQRFTFKTVVQEQIRNSRGDLLSPENLLGDLAIQFGQAVGGSRRALRSFLVNNDNSGKPIQPDPSKYTSLTDPHSRGALLVAAIFDAFTRLYRHRVADLLRLASGGTGILSQGAISPDLIIRLSDEACEIANKLMLVCIRALDYCPPIDLTFGDYLRALITADVEHSPEDGDGLRFALLESFRSWGIVPVDINTYSVGSLMWKSFEEANGNSAQIDNLKRSIQFVFNPDITAEANSFRKENPSINSVVGSMDKILRENDRNKIFNESRKLSAAVHGIFDEKFEYFVNGMERLLGMNFADIEYKFRDDEFDEDVTLRAPSRFVFQVHKCRPLIRHNNREGITSKILLMTFLQKVYVDLKGSVYEGYFKGDRYEMRGGATLIVDLATYEIRYAVVKTICSPNRLKDQLQYMINNMDDQDNAALLLQETEPFSALHLH